MDPVSNIWQVALALVLIVAVVYGLGYVARRLPGMGGGLSGSAEKNIKVLESTYLGPKERLVMVEVAGQKLLLAINPQAITKITEVTGSVFADTFKTKLEEANH